MIDDIVKQSIFNLIIDDMPNASILDLGQSIWIIDKEKRYWYFEYQVDTKNLWWRLDFFEPYLEPFGINHPRFSFIFGEFFNHYLKVNDFKSKEISKLCEADFVSEFEIDDILSDDRHLEIKMKQIIDEKRLDA